MKSESIVCRAGAEISVRAIRAFSLAFGLVLLMLAQAHAATLRGTIYDASGITGLDIGGTLYDVTFTDAGSGTFYDTFAVDAVTPGLTAANSLSFSEDIMDAIQDVVRPLGPIQVNNGQTFLVLPFASAFGEFSYLTTRVGNGNYGFVWGPFTADIRDDAFANVVSFVTVEAQAPALLTRTESASFGDPHSAFTSPVVAPIPLPPAGWMLLAGLAGGAALSRRRRAQRAH